MWDYFLQSCSEVLQGLLSLWTFMPNFLKPNYKCWSVLLDQTSSNSREIIWDQAMGV